MRCIGEVNCRAGYRVGFTVALKTVEGHRSEEDTPEVWRYVQDSTEQKGESGRPVSDALSWESQLNIYIPRCV